MIEHKRTENIDRLLLSWIVPLFLAVISYGVTAFMAEVVHFMWPYVKLSYFVGFFGASMSFVGYFSTAHPRSPDRANSLVPELFLLIIFSKLYTLFVLPFREFLIHLHLLKFVEINRY